MRYRGIAYRAHRPEWAFSPLSGEGAERYGGRFNQKGVPALYLAITEVLALAEYNQGFLHRPQPKTLCAYNLNCDDILDLTDAHSRDIAKITLDELGCAWESIANGGATPPTWSLSNRLITDGYAGVIAPSFATNAPPEGVNIILWDWSESLPHQVLLIDDDSRLPADQSSWSKRI